MFKCGLLYYPALWNMEHGNTHVSKLAAPRISYCFTYNNYTDAGIEALRKYLEENCKYACYQKEVAPTTGTPHLQGYMNLKKKQRMTTIQKNLVGNGIQLTLINANGTPEANRTYCSKIGGQDFWEIGDIKIVGQGKRTDLMEVAEKVLAQRPIREIALENPTEYIKYYRGINALQFAIMDIPTERPMEVVLLFGDSGTGKSTKARQYASLYGKYYTLQQPNNGAIWWDGYSGELSVIIDEYKGWITPTTLNAILDKYKLALPIKGGTTYAMYEHVFITSNFPPEEWYSEKVIWNKQALYRRLTTIYQYKGTNFEDSVVTKLK